MRTCSSISISRRVFRFAPSPNGFLHLGHVFSALRNYELAQECGGRFLLRIEDIDLSRARPEFERRFTRIWLGWADWERPVRKQSEHFADYFRALERLEAPGLLYPCVCTRADIARAAQGRPTRSRRRAALSGNLPEQATSPDPRVLRTGGVALRLDMGKALKLAPPLSPGANLASATSRRGAGAMGRRCFGAQGHADELSSRGRCRRRAARRHRCRARQGSISRDERASAIAATVGSSRAGLSPS